jgi:hypothetical protein
MVEDKNKKVHPIVEKVLELAYQGFKSIEFDDYAIEQIEDLLKQYVGTPELFKAVVDLLNLANLLDKEGSHSASLKLLNAICSIAEYLDDGLEGSK